VYHSALLHENEMIVCCGFRGKKPINEMWSFHLDTLEWKQMSDGKLSPRSGHASGILGDCMFMFGGEGATEDGVTVENDLWTYHFASQVWEEIKIPERPPQRLGVKAASCGNQFTITCGIKVSKEWNPEEWFHDVWTLSS